MGQGRGILWMSSTSRILLRREPPVLEIVINRPEVRNAMDRETRQEIIRALDDIEEDPEIRVIILSGQGGKAFSAGADLGMFLELSPREALEYTRISKGCVERISRFPKPVIAKVQGVALGGGLELALACDLIYASPDAKFGQTEVNVGLMPGAGGTQRLPRAVGVRRAREWTYTGRWISAEEAERVGLVNGIFPAAQLDAAVREVAGTLAAKSPLVLRRIKEALRMAEELPLSQGLEFESRNFALCFGTEDLREGIEAFRAKRTPRFQGR